MDIKNKLNEIEEVLGIKLKGGAYDLEFFEDEWKEFYNHTDKYKGSVVVDMVKSWYNGICPQDEDKYRDAEILDADDILNSTIEVAKKEWSDYMLECGFNEEDLNPISIDEFAEGEIDAIDESKDGHNDRITTTMEWYARRLKNTRL